MTEGYLKESASVLLSGAGAGTAKVGPLTDREKWTNVTVSVSTRQVPTAIVNEAQCIISVGDANTKSFRDSTVSGSSGDSTTNVTDTIRSSMYVWAEWTGGDAGVYATITVTGKKEV